MNNYGFKLGVRGRGIIFRTILVSITVLLASCATGKDSFLAGFKTPLYAEPADGPRARVRISGSSQYPTISPGIACGADESAGAGLPMPPRFAGLKGKRDLGMPKTSDESHPMEVFVRAGEPVTMKFSAGASAANYSCPPAPPGYRRYCPAPPPAPPPPCVRKQSFVPEQGKDYEMVFTYLSSQVCDVQVFAIEADAAGGYHQRRVPSRAAEKCATPLQPK